jgi:hypothetical protein
MSVVINGTSGISGVDGSAGTPAVQGSDNNTGVFFPAADTAAIATNGAERMRIDSSGNVLVTNVAGLGYGTGAGGTVTQATSKSTAVTLNKPTGQITMNAAALAAGAAVVFNLNNILITSVDCVVVSVGGGTGTHTAQIVNAVNGACQIRVTNTTGGSLSEAVAINFAIIKGATS